jgi:hypothetical protein
MVLCMVFVCVKSSFSPQITIMTGYVSSYREEEVDIHETMQ